MAHWPPWSWLYHNSRVAKVISLLSLWGSITFYDVKEQCLQFFKRLSPFCCQVVCHSEVQEGFFVHVDADKIHVVHILFLQTVHSKCFWQLDGHGDRHFPPLLNFILIFGIAKTKIIMITFIHLRVIALPWESYRVKHAMMCFHQQLFI